MENIFDITYKGETVGKAVLTKEGLMFKIHCLCSLPEDRAYQVILTAATEMNLGLLAKEAGGLGLTKRLAIKQLANEIPRFEAIARDEEPEQKFYQVEEGKLFEPLDQLKNAALEDRNGTLGILADPIDPVQEIPGNDLSPESEDGSQLEQFDSSDPEM